jgi:hypothetical protein
MTIKPHPTEPMLFMADDPTDFIGWRLAPYGTNVSEDVGIVVLWKIKEHGFRFRKVLCPKVIVPVATVQFLPTGGHEYKLALHVPIEWT